MLPGTTAEAELGSVVHTRDVLVKQRTILLNKIRVLFTRHGWKLKKEGLASRKRLRELDLSRFMPLVELAGPGAEPVGDDQGARQGDRAGGQRAGWVRGTLGHQGHRFALGCDLAGIGNVNDFESADKLVAYVSIVPRVNQSNETDNRGRITKRGDKLTRTTLVQCTLTAMCYSVYLHAFYRRIKERRGQGYHCDRTQVLVDQL